jgi:hypothetical protein
LIHTYLIAVLLAEPWPINFLIPLANGMSDTLTLPSNTLWEAARFSIAEAMDISVKSLNIAYVQILNPWSPQPLPYPLIRHQLGRTHPKGIRLGRALEEEEEPKAFRSTCEGFQRHNKIQEREGWQGWNQKGDRFWASEGEGCQAGEGV